MCEIDITGLDKVKLLHELWNGQIIASFFTFKPTMAPKFKEEEAHQAVQGYIDYFCGRCIKTDLTKDSVSPRMYDRDAGTGAFMRAVQAVKVGSNVVDGWSSSSDNDDELSSNNDVEQTFVK